MAITLTGNFAMRRDADMTIERLVQEFGVERTDIFVAAAGDDNSAGEIPAGSDGEAGAPSPEDRGDAALAGAITVSVDVQDDDAAARLRDAFVEFDADDLVEE